ncbi:sialate O-acetylesterase [Flagellimonas sp.]|uniref:sialate O-acetylesterase n=1 Tax=Flagellimonas sp. TaxID=2058762 RepID=UPI003BB0CED2
MLKIENFIVVTLLLLSSNLIAQIELPSFFSDNMVLQRNEDVSIWGKDKPNSSIEILGDWGEKVSGYADKYGKWELKLKTPGAGGPHKVTIKGTSEINLNNVLIGEVWLCSGQSNMVMPLKGFHDGKSPINGSKETVLNSKNPEIRLFKNELKASLTPVDDVVGEWMMAEPGSVIDFSALAYHFGVELNDILNVPIGLIQTAWGGSSIEAWMDKNTLSMYKEFKLPKEVPNRHKNVVPTLLYNGMLKPYIPFSIRGILWYQGEANVRNAEEYKTLFPAMINSWRNKWGDSSLPFYFVQLAPYKYSKGLPVNSAYLREAQLQTMGNTENTGMAVTLDIGDCNDIHPAEKKVIGKRLASWALAKVYGMNHVVYSGPVYESVVKRSDGKLRLKFKFDDGLNFLGNDLKGFKIAGKDMVFYQAQVRVNANNTIDVWSDKVKRPKAVRYAFDNCAEGTLFNGAGLPAPSFRTDNWPQ